MTRNAGSERSLPDKHFQFFEVLCSYPECHADRYLVEYGEFSSLKEDTALFRRRVNHTSVRDTDYRTPSQAGLCAL